MKPLLILGSVVAIIVSVITGNFINTVLLGSGSGTIDTLSLFTRVGTALHPINSSDTLGSSSTPITGGYFENLETGQAQIGTLNLTGIAVSPFIVGGTASTTLYGNGATSTFGGNISTPTGNLITAGELSASSPLLYNSSTKQFSISLASSTSDGYLSSTDFGIFNGKQDSLVSGTSIKTVGGISILGSGDLGVVGIGYGGTGITSTPTNGQILIGNGTNYSLSTLTAGNNIDITNGTGTITIASTASGSGGSSFWTATGTPARVSNTQFTITSGDFTNLFSRGTVLKWTETSTVNQGVVVSSSFSTPITTVNIIGDAMDSIDASSLKYSLNKARTFTLAVAGTIGATSTDIAGRFNAPFPLKIFGADLYAGTAGNGTTTIDVNKNGTTMFTTKPYINGTNTKGEGFTADAGTTLTTGDYVSIDLDSPALTTKITDLYVNVLYSPLNDIYLP